MKPASQMIGGALALASLVAAGAVDELMPVPRKAELTGGETEIAALGDVRTQTGPVPGAPAFVAEEAYVLVVSPEGVRMTAPTPKGLRYARVTFEQLKRLSANGRIENCRIVDWPEYRWRGYMPDTARNYLDLQSMKDMIDIMAAYKLNLLHWHLTEHYGWRLESKKYPELHGPKAFLNRHPGKYYTQEEFREIVDYAWERGIATMPELDVPGHATAFRRAFGMENMDNPRATEILEDVFRELCALTSVEKMPFVHMGTDEVWNKAVEGAKRESISRWAKAITDSGRRVVSWEPGQDYDATNRVAMLWGRCQEAGIPSFDANRMYIETLDPFELLPLATYHTPFYGGTSPENRWGAIFCGWHDGFVGERYADVFRNQAVFPCCVLLGNVFWRGCAEHVNMYRTRLPLAGDPLLARAVEVERRVIAQRDKALRGLRHPFHFVGQTHMRWRLTNEKGELVATDIAQATISPRKDPLRPGNFTEVTNGVMTAETWIRSPKTQTVGAWIGFLGMDRDHGLEHVAGADGATPRRGEWNAFGAYAELNGERIPPPAWKRPGLKLGKVLEWGPVPWWHELGEEPYTDQEYFMREPARITLKEGWNNVRLVAPCPGKKVKWDARWWIMTFCPVLGTTDHPREVPGLEYSATPPEPAGSLPCAGDAAWAAKRAAAVGRVRPLVYNTDGCDVLYWPSNLPVTVGNFTGRRLKDALGTHITTVSYCPQSAGFGHFICREAGEPLTGDVPHPDGGRYNSASAFFALGTDALKMATEFCATNGLEVFVSVRVNDQHDSASRPGNLSALYPPFKLAHPECLMGSLDRSRNKELYPRYAGWSCVNFDCELVRERMKSFVRELVTNYDVDGIEYDFNRHFMLFRSVATGGVATASEIGKMTQLMRDLRAITEEVGRRKNRPIVVTMRMPDSVGFDLAVGADIVTWFREKLVDVWIGGGYFLLNQLPESVALAHRYGIRFYWSLDESRIPGYAAGKGLKSIPGRNSVPFYTGRFAAAQAAGCDGVYVFNLENSGLRKVAAVDPRDTAGLEKVYFAVDRGAGGYEPEHWLKDGGRFSNLPKLDPGRPHEMKPGETLAFEMFLGDDFGGATPPKATALALANLGDADLALTVNGRALRMKADAGGLFSCPLPAGALRKGLNAFTVTFPASAPAKATFNDFAVRVSGET